MGFRNLQEKLEKQIAQKIRENVAVDEKSAYVIYEWSPRNQCHLPPGLKYGFYLPWAVILIAIVIIGCILRRDWYGEKRLFSHITKHPVRILK